METQCQLLKQHRHLGVTSHSGSSVYLRKLQRLTTIKHNYHTDTRDKDDSGDTQTRKHAYITHYEIT